MPKTSRSVCLQKSLHTSRHIWTLTTSKYLFKTEISFRTPRRNKQMIWNSQHGGLVVRTFAESFWVSSFHDFSAGITTLCRISKKKKHAYWVNWRWQVRPSRSQKDPGFESGHISVRSLNVWVFFAGFLLHFVCRCDRERERSFVDYVRRLNTATSQVSYDRLHVSCHANENKNYYYFFFKWMDG